MIQINLLPKELRRKRRIRPRIDFADFQSDKIKLFIVGGYVALLLFMLLTFSLGSFIRKKQVASLKVKETSISPMSGRVEEINKDISLLRAKMSALAEITKRDFLWSKKLNELSDLVLPGIWFSRVHTESLDRLIVEGSVLAEKETGMATVGRFIKNLREHASFFKDFKDIKLESVRRKDVQKREVLDFTIVLYFG